MDPENKIDLRSLNKTKKRLKLPRPTNPFKNKSAGPGRDSVGRFAPTGFKLKNRRLNKKALTVVVLLVAAVGGFYVYRSNATTGDVFSKPASQLTGGTLTSKSDGRQYRFNNTSDISTNLTLTQMNTTKQFCAYIKTVADSYVFITVTTTPVNKSNNTVLTRSKTVLVPKDKGTEVCTTTVTNVSNTVSGGKVTVGTAKFDSSGNFISTTKSTVGVEKIYGRSETTPPTVTITSPSNNDIVYGKTVYLAATATDNVGVAKVEFSVDNKLVSTDTTSPYYYNSWDSTTVNNGTHTLKVTAHDQAGNTKAVTLSFIVNNANTSDVIAPTVTITSPVPVPPSTIARVAGKSVNLAATATDNVGITKVEFKVNNTLVNTDTTTPYAYIWDSTLIESTKTTPLGTNFTVVAYDAAGNKKESLSTIIIDNTPDTSPPTVTITSPAENSQITGMVDLAATVNDNFNVTKVEFKVDGVLINTDVTSPYTYRWNSATVSNGSHVLSVIAYDASNNKTVKNRNLYVNIAAQKLRIVYAGVNFAPSDTFFDSYVNNQISSLLNYYPFSNYRNEISFASARLGTVACGPISGGVTRAWACDYVAVAQKLAEAGVTYDKVLVVNNSPEYGGTGQLNGSFATVNSRSDYADKVGLHELFHTFGLRDEYYESAGTAPSSSGAFHNCYDGRSNNPHYAGIPTNQMFSGCTYSNWYRSSDSSIMSTVAGPTAESFSPAARSMMDDVLEGLL